MANNTRWHRRGALATVISITVALTLTGCFANPVDQLKEKVDRGVAQEGAEKLVEKATGGKVEAELGGELPKGFPEEIPLIDGKIVTAMHLADDDDGESWSVTLQPKNPEADLAQAKKQLESAGFVESSWSDLGAMQMGTYKDSTYSVNLSMMSDDTEDGILSYQVFRTADID